MDKVDFSGEMFSVLAEGEKVEHSLSEFDNYQFPEWDILRELGRRNRRTERDKGKDIRGWMRRNPEKVEEIRKKHGELDAKGTSS